MPSMDAKILPTEGVEEGRVVIHPHSSEAYVFFNHEWHMVSNGAKATETNAKNEAYDRAMKGV